jgi:hypothetical protein
MPLGLLFRLPRPANFVSAVVHSGITQALLCEPGVAQKAFALLTYWHHNGFVLNRPLIAHTIEQIIYQHATIGVTSDVSWALSFCLEQNIQLSRRASRILSTCDDDCIMLQALHCKSQNLLPQGFSTARVSRALKDAEIDGEHWLLAYEATRQGFLTDSAPAVAASPLFADLLQRKVTFYRRILPLYASVVHPGGAPEWVVSEWLDTLEGRRPELQVRWTVEKIPILGLIQADLPRLQATVRSSDQTMTKLLDVEEPELLVEEAEAEEEIEEYSI